MEVNFWQAHYIKNAPRNAWLLETGGNLDRFHYGFALPRPTRRFDAESSDGAEKRPALAAMFSAGKIERPWEKRLAAIAKSRFCRAPARIVARFSLGAA